MRSPFRTEARAFRFVPLVGIAAGAVIVADVLGSTVAVAVVAALAVTGLLIAYLFGGGRPHGIPSAPGHVGPPAERRTLLLVEAAARRDDLSGLGGAERVLVVSLASATPLRRWFSDLDGAREKARREMDEAVSALRDLHVEAAGVVGDDAFQAVDDALRTFGGDEIVVAGGDHELAARLRARYALPVVAVEAL